MDRLTARPAFPDETQEDLRRARDAAESANAAKTRYLVAVSHELRSPLNAIYGYAQLLEREGAISPVEAGRVIRRSAEHLGDLIEGLIEISRVENGVIKLSSDVVPLQQFLDHIIDMFKLQAQAKGLAFHCIVKDKLPQNVRTDSKRLRQILINLLSNAIKYTQEGEVTLTVSYRSQVASFEIADTGIGIAAEEIETIFEPFERGSSQDALSQPGVGLGLSITRLLARILGGEIFVRSTPGKGSTFTHRAFLPQTVDLPEEEADATQVTGYHGSRKTVLAIDDDLSQLGVVRGLLSPLGFEVFTASHPAEGFALADLCNPDIVLLDVQMPGQSGWELGAQLREKHGPAFPIVMVSANVHDYDPMVAEKSGDYAVVTKPVDQKVLLDVIAAQLGIEWKCGQEAAAPSESSMDPLPSETGPSLDRMRLLAKSGKVRDLDRAINDLAAEFPVSSRVVAILREHLDNYDLRSLLKTIDHVYPR